MNSSLCLLSSSILAILKGFIPTILPTLSVPKAIIESLVIVFMMLDLTLDGNKVTTI